MTDQLSLVTEHRVDETHFKHSLRPGGPPRLRCTPPTTPAAPLAPASCLARVAKSDTFPRHTTATPPHRHTIPTCGLTTLSPRGLT
eukprot:3329146-Prymnesium_polylepis.2